MIEVDIPKDMNNLEWNTICERHLKMIDDSFLFQSFWALALWIARGSMQIPLSSGHLSLPGGSQQSDEINWLVISWDCLYLVSER